MRHASLFSGIGGFELAASWMGWENMLSCEVDPFCQKVLKHHFPSTTLYGDIRKLDGTTWRGQIDILTGGFPCQPFSAAGRRRGTEDDRFLWPEMLRVIREIQPTWVVAENVRGLLTIDDGMVFSNVLDEMEWNGYEVQSFLIPAPAVGCSHQRFRIWMVANYVGFGVKRRGEIRKLATTEKEKQGQMGESIGKWHGDATDNSCTGFRRSHGDTIEAATRLCRVDDGLPRELDGITVPKWRRESLKAYGNAIVPQVAFHIFQAIASSLPV